MMQTYFTFPDGALRYDCPSCGQRCCKGRGFSLGDNELLPLLGKVPRLAPYLRLRPGGSAYAVDVTDGCWFLAGDGRCQIEVDHGRAAKPSTCKLFPFNRVFRVRGVRVIDVNTTLCPVQLAPGAGVRHQEIVDDIAALGDSAVVDVPAPEPRELPDDWLAHEQSATEVVTSGARWQSWCALYDTGRPTDERIAQVAARVRVLLPSLRFNFLFRRDAPSWPLATRRLPARAAALTLLAAVAPSPAPPSLQALTELWHEAAFALDVLERWDEPVQLAGMNFQSDVPALLQPALGALLSGAFRASQNGQTLGALLLHTATALPVEARPLVVALAASLRATLLP